MDRTAYRTTLSSDHHQYPPRVKTTLPTLCKTDNFNKPCLLILILILNKWDIGVNAHAHHIAVQISLMETWSCVKLTRIAHPQHCSFPHPNPEGFKFMFVYARLTNISWCHYENVSVKEFKTRRLLSCPFSLQECMITIKIFTHSLIQIYIPENH